MLADLLATASGLELVDVEIHGDRRPNMSNLALHPDGVESALREVRPVRVTVVMERELRHPSGLRFAALVALSSPRVETLR